MFLKASHSGRGGAQSATERAFLYEYLPTPSAYADSSPGVGASKKLNFKCYKVVGEPHVGSPTKTLIFLAPFLPNPCAEPHHDKRIYQAKRKKRSQIFKKNRGCHHGRRRNRQVIRQFEQIQNQNIRIRNPCLQTKTKHRINGICTHHGNAL